MDFTRRTFLAGFGSAAVGLLLSRRLERVLDDLSRESAAELSPTPAAASQLPVAADVVVQPQTWFRPERLVIQGTVVGTRRVPVHRVAVCSACDGEEADEGSCDACAGVGYVDQATGEEREERVLAVPWVVEDVIIGTRSQLCQPGGVSGEAFSNTAVDSLVSFETAPPGSEIRVRVRYVGDRPEGEHFRAAFVGSTPDGRAVLPVGSFLPVAAERPATAGAA